MNGCMQVKYTLMSKSVSLQKQSFLLKLLTGKTNNDIRTDFKMASISMDNALKRCTTCSTHEPITLSEELPCPGITTFSLTSLFLELFRREFRKSFKFHKPVTKTLSRQNGIFVLLMTFTFLF